MQHSKSLVSFTYSCVDSDTDNLLGPNRPRNRSSLDTFLIPRRTRIPSHNPDPFDVQITQNLLKSSMDALSQDPSPSAKHVESRSDHHPIKSTPPTDSDFEHDVHYGVGESLYRFSPSASRPEPRPVRPGIGSRHGLVVHKGRPHLHGARAHAPRNEIQRHESSKQKPTYDGPQDSSCESRVSSTTYSMVSRRVFTDSSGSSREYSGSRFNEEYNHLAAKHGLPEIDLTQNGE